MPVPVLPEGADLPQVRSAMLEAVDQWKSIRSKPQEEITESDKSDLLNIRSFILDGDPIEKFLARQEAENKAAAEALESAGPRAANMQPTQRVLSTGEFFTADKGYAEFAQRHSANGNYHEVKIPGNLHQRALITEGNPLTTYGDGVTGAGTLVPIGTPLVLPNRRRRLFLRDLIPSSDTGLIAIPYIQELNPIANELGASGVAEGTAKPEVTMEWIETIAPVKKIAAWIPVTTEIIDDAPTLRGYINDRLTYMVKLREEVELLSGPGTGARIRGILNQVDQNNVSAIQTQASVNNDLPATVAAAYGKLENVDGEADAVAIHPITFWSAVATRHATTFDAGYSEGAPNRVPNITWGLEPLRTRGIPLNKFLAGAYGTAAHIWDKEDVTIRVGNQHSDYFVSNKIVILAEERLALTVWRPDWFVYADFVLA